jgi:hypothetical protein
MNGLVTAGVDGGALIKVAWVSLLSGLGLTIAFCGVLYTGTRSLEARREGNGAGAAGFGALAAICALIVAVAIVGGFAFMLSK